MFFKSSALAKIRVGSKQGRVHWTSTAKRLQSASLSVGTRQSNRRPGDGAAQPTGPRRDKPGTGVSSPGLSTDTQQACSPSPLLQTKSALTVSVLSHVKMITLLHQVAKVLELQLQLQHHSFELSLALPFFGIGNEN